MVREAPRVASSSASADFILHPDIGRLIPVGRRIILVVGEIRSRPAPLRVFAKILHLAAFQVQFHLVVVRCVPLLVQTVDTVRLPSSAGFAHYTSA